MEYAAVVIVGGLAAILLFLWRYSERRRAAAVLEANRFRQMLKEQVERPSVMSHEIRTPLSLIKGAAVLLTEETPGPLTDKQRVFVQTISDNANTVIQLAEDLLAVSQLDAQLFEMRLGHVDLRSQVRLAVRELRRVHTAPIRLDNQGSPLLVIGDHGLLRQALTNLINNAARHAGEGVPITVRVRQDGLNAIISVSDSGAGMTKEDRERLFQPFKVGSSNKPGTGLGMMIVQRIVEMHGGKILVDTEVDQGTDIFITVPLEGKSDG